MMTKRREPEHTVRLVYLLVRAGKALSAHLTRADARLAQRRCPEARVIRCEVVETRRARGGA